LARAAARETTPLAWETQVRGSAYGSVRKSYGTTHTEQGLDETPAAQGLWGAQLTVPVYEAPRARALRGVPGAPRGLRAALTGRASYRGDATNPHD
jgi:hypothetical protein